jgi:hypothetical protein
MAGPTFPNSGSVSMFLLMSQVNVRVRFKSRPASGTGRFAAVLGRIPEK